MSEKTFEYQLSWAASSNISFRGKSGWIPYDEDAESAEEVEEQMMKGGTPCDALAEVLDACGFDWSLEVREAKP